MLKAMLVDFNPEIVNFYRSYLKATFPAVRVVAFLSEASVDKFYEQINTKEPNFMIMDIRFFALSTLKIISEVASKYPNLKMLIVGTYEDHDYLRASMERGAADYLYRPIKGREFELCMGRIIRIFEEGKEKEREEEIIKIEYERNRALFRDRFLTNLLNGVLVNEEEIETSLQYFSMETEPPYAVFVLRIDRFKSVMSNLSEKQKHLLIYRVFYASQEFLLSRNLGYAFINSFNSISCILCGIKDFDGLMAVCAEIKSEVFKKTELSVTIGLGRPQDSISSVNISSKEAEAALRYRHLLGYNTIIPIDYVEPDNKTSYRYPARKERLLVYTAVAGEYEYAIVLLNQILDTLRESAQLPERILPKIIMNIVISISRYASELHLDIDTRFRDFFDFGVILEIRSIDEAKTYLENALKSFCGFIAAGREKAAETLVGEIVEHINNHFYEDISVEKLAREKKTTPEYLGQIFTKRTGLAIKDYLTTQRLKQAKLILEKEETDDDILAARVGYRDVRVFRSIFRRREGMLPGEYARRARRKDL